MHARIYLLGKEGDCKRLSCRLLRDESDACIIAIRRDFNTLLSLLWQKPEGRAGAGFGSIGDPILISNNGDSTLLLLRRKRTDGRADGRTDGRTCG